MPALPTQPGSYALHLFLDSDRPLEVGKLGIFQLPAGHYVYLGSAHGPGGLQARLKRHLNSQGTQHWHIDWLRHVSRLMAVFYSTEAAQSERQPLECCWSQALAALPGATIPVRRFGAGDCQLRCSAHLVAFPAEAMTSPGRGFGWALEACGAKVSQIRVVGQSPPFAG
ncbi:MAG TPA: GIY-YIG nuclease family protein [Anaerolineales bacterium]|nr:GIY-YIG nuclease family protein [Anaerolineales bacterium]